MMANEVWEKRTPKGIVRIRFGDMDDFAGVIALRNSEKNLGPANQNEYVGALKTGRIVVATIEGKIVGFSKFPSLIVVRENFRKIGIGGAMAAFSIKFAKKTKYTVFFIGGNSDAMLKIFAELEKANILKIEDAVEIDSYNLELQGEVPRQRENNVTIFRKKHGWKIAK